MEVVDDLGEDASPVDGVDGTEVEGRVDVLIGEEDLENILCCVRWGCYGRRGRGNCVLGSRRKCLRQRGCGRSCRGRWSFAALG